MVTGNKNAGPGKRMPCCGAVGGGGGVVTLGVISAVESGFS